MDRSLSAAIVSVAIALTALGSPEHTVAQTSVRHVRVLSNKGAVEIEIEGSDRLVPQAQMLAGPDRLVVDFPNAVPGAQLRNQAVNRGDVKSVRVGLFAANPPVTRIVFDLTSAQSYQVFPYGRTVMVKLGGGADAGTNTAGIKAAALNSATAHLSPTAAALMNTNSPAQQQSVAAPAPKSPLQVSFENGLLTILADKATLSEILFAVHQRTGADIPIPAGAEQEKVAAALGPAPAAEVLAQLLNGSKFNFLILSSESDPRLLDRVILSQRAGGPAPAYQPPLQSQPIASSVQPQMQEQNDTEADAEPPQPMTEPVQPVPAPNAPPPGRQAPPSTPESRSPPADSDQPE
jgi:hypothetical protein